MKKMKERNTARERKPRSGIPFWRQPRFRYGSLSTALLCLCLAALLAVCLLCDRLEERFGWRVDCSFNAITTQSEQTLDVLAALEHPVHIYALFQRGQEDGPLLELLARYAAASPLVTWEQTDLTMNPGLIARFTTDTGDISRAFVLGCSTLLTSSDLYAMTVSESFLIRAVEYLLDTEPVDLGIVSRLALRPQLSVDSALPGSFLLLLLPVSVICAAVVVLWPRRNR